MKTLSALVLGVLAVGLCSPAAADEKDYPKDIVGKWEITKSDLAPVGSIVEFTKDGKVLATGGDRRLGGMDFDNLILEKMFAAARQGGLDIETEPWARQDAYGKTLHVAPAYDSGVLPDIRKWFEAYYTIQFANYPVDPSYLSHGGVAVECRPAS